MSERRVDRIRRILESIDDCRARVWHVLRELRRMEGNSELPNAVVYIAVNAENRRLVAMGESPLFRTSSTGGEDRGWISIAPPRSFGSGTLAGSIENEIIKANRKVDKDLYMLLEKMDWRTFENTFLERVLEELGFQDVEVTQATRDGGADARVTYKRGIVEAKAIVSAKRWSSKSAVSVEEVRMLRGIKGDEDTAIVITTGRFTADAEREARPSQNQRVVYLIDGKRLVEICKRHEIGVKKKQLPAVLVLDDEQLAFEEEADDEEDLIAAGEATAGAPEERQSQSEDASQRSHSPPEQPARLRRLRDGMLHEISARDISKLTGLSQDTIRNDLSVPARRSELAKRIRDDKECREAILRLVAIARGCK